MGKSPGHWLTDMGSTVPQHPYNKALGSIPISYPGIAILVVGNGSRWNTREPRTPDGSMQDGKTV